MKTPHTEEESRAIHIQNMEELMANHLQAETDAGQPQGESVASQPQGESVAGQPQGESVAGQHQGESVAQEGIIPLDQDIISYKVVIVLVGLLILLVAQQVN